MTASKIEWTERSDWNPIRGCTRVSEGCRHCYAEQIAGRFSDPGQAFHGFAKRASASGRWTGRVELVEDRLTLPLRWRKPALIFASSTSDIFHESLSDSDIDRIFAVMALARQHRFQVLTKRSARMRSYLSAFEERPDAFGAALAAVARAAGFEKQAGLDAIDDMLWPLPNVWLGVSVENQATAGERIPDLLAAPAVLRFLSCEPLLGPVDLSLVSYIDDDGDELHHSALTGQGFMYDLGIREEGIDTAEELTPDWAPTVDWVIAGGESGRGARPMHPDWARGLRDQCAAADVPFFFKQWGEWVPLAENGNGFWPSDEGGSIRLLPTGERNQEGWPMQRVGKSCAGRLIDDAQHDGMPG